MAQEASTALIVAIVAIVLGALGLIGGAIGYVQGTAALRRATLTRQRAIVAEEAALHARTQAEQAVRTAQSLLDRFSGVGVRSIGDVADLPTGPLVLPPRHAFATDPSLTPSTGEHAAPMAAVSPSTPAPRAPEPAPESLFPRPAAASEDVTDSIEPASLPATDPTAVPLGTGPTLLPPPTGSVSVPSTGSTDLPRFAEQSTGEVELPVESQHIAPAIDPEIAAASGPIDLVAPEPEEDQPGPVDEPEPEPEPAPEPAPEPESAELAQPQRSVTGQVNAAPRGVSPMDWAEVLRTGAIPLPSRSRGTYAAPSKAKGQPIGPVRFEIRAVGRQKFEAVNVGGVTAEQAEVEGAGDDRHLVRPLELSAKSVAPGASLAFSVLRVEGRRVSVHLTWMAGGDEEQAELPVP